MSNRLAEEREVRNRYGESTALAGGCGHPKPVRIGATSIATCQQLSSV
jgi:hypothetical protein